MATRGTSAHAAGPTLGSYLASFDPSLSWDVPPRWPPDAFAMANLVLDCTEGYRFAVALVSGHRCDEPGATVLTLTSYAMAARSHPAGTRRSRAVGVWSEPGTGLHQLDLAPRSVGIVISLAVSTRTVWTADGRRHERSTPAARLTGIEQLRIAHERTAAWRHARQEET